MARCPSCGQDNPTGFRFCGSCGAELAPAPAPREVRKTVTVLFCDVTGSTAMGERLDPESTRRVMARYFDAMREAIERHGGTVEKFIGDAVMAVYGIPVVHEDDALRAVRAAADMREALGRLNEELERDWGVRIESRIGVNTGEVVTGEGETLAVGDAVNVAARLEQGAAPGETLLGESTHRLVRDAVDAEPVEPLDAKGKSEPLTAYRLTGLVEGAEFIPRRLDSPLVGRENELSQLQRAFDHAVSERVAYLFTLLGPAGIGKSRLVRELRGSVDATFLEGRCLPYGEGITYWPLSEIAPLASELDLRAKRDEIALQTRRILERLSRERPLVVVFENLQWAEPTFLDLVDHVADLARDAPMLLVCVARPELLDARPGWGGGKLNATTMLLEALSREESAQLVDNLLLAHVDSALKERIAAAAEGNPLYVEEMLAMITEGVNGDVAVPPTIQALLAARLDRLPVEERAVVDCAAVQGQEFDRDALVSLLPEPLARRLPETLQSLVRKDLVRPAADDAFRFKHLLLRDAAYEALPKEQRADLHEGFAARVDATRPELQEIIGYHLEQAYRHRADLGPVDDRTRDLARRASALLAAAGRRANERGDVHATINLLERAVKLLPEGDPDAVSLLPDLARAYSEGGDFQRPDELYRTAEERGDAPTRLHARLGRIWLGLLQGGTMAEPLGLIEEIAAEAERLGDEALLAEALLRLGIVHAWLGDNETGELLLRRALEHARPLDAVHLKSQTVHWIALVMLWGSTPVEQAVRECRDLPESLDLDQTARTELLVVEGTFLGLAGDFERGRALAAQGREALRELGQRVQYAAIAQPSSMIELLAGDAPAAERMLREAHAILSAAGEQGYLSTVAALLALALVKQGKHAEAAELADEARRIGAEDDVTTQLYWRIAKAQVAAARGAAHEAAHLAAEVIDLATGFDTFDGPVAAVEVVDYLEPGDARTVLELAVAGAEAKGNVVTAGQARAKLAALP
ncbi:MAG TPA: adenylate/guanylate cyclase domain-containing protein [Gaiellaceae bacterium]|nr:adenylate/guanylate cyclase domain-containing protein [Gaiellaceae bacterium]